MASKLSTTDQSFLIDIDLSQLKFDVCLKIHSFIEHRIKIVTSSDTTFKPGETKFIPTNLIFAFKKRTIRYYLFNI